MLSNIATRGRIPTDIHTEKTNTQQDKTNRHKEKTPYGDEEDPPPGVNEDTEKEESHAEADESLPTEEDDHAEKMTEVQEEKDKTRTLFNPTSWYYASNPLFSNNIYSKALPVFAGTMCIPSLYSRISYNVINVRLYFVNVSLTH